MVKKLSSVYDFTEDKFPSSNQIIRKTNKTFWLTDS